MAVWSQDMHFLAMVSRLYKYIASLSICMHTRIYYMLCFYLLTYTYIHTICNLPYFKRLNLFSAGLHCALLAGISQRQMSFTYLGILPIPSPSLCFNTQPKYFRSKYLVCFRISRCQKSSWRRWLGAYLVDYTIFIYGDIL